MKKNLCSKCGSNKTNKEKVYQNVWKGNEVEEVYAGNLICCKNCVDTTMEDFEYWEKLTDKLELDCIRYWQLSYDRNSQNQLGFYIRASGGGDDWFSEKLDEEENKQLSAIIAKNDKNAFREFITQKLTDITQREKEIRTSRTEADKKERKLHHILNTLETMKYEVEELIKEVVPIWKEARRKYETGENDSEIDLKTVSRSEIYTELERRKSLHKKEIKECWECGKETDDWFYDFGDNYQCRNCHNDLIEENKKDLKKEKKEKIKCSECGKTKLLGYRKNYFTEYCKNCWEFVKKRDRDCWEWCADDCPFKIARLKKIKDHE